MTTLVGEVPVGSEVGDSVEGGAAVDAPVWLMSSSPEHAASADKAIDAAPARSARRDDGSGVIVTMVGEGLRPIVPGGGRLYRRARISARWRTDARHADLADDPFVPQAAVFGALRYKRPRKVERIVS